MKKEKIIFGIILILALIKVVHHEMEIKNKEKVKEFQEITEEKTIQKIEKPMKSYSKEELKQQYENLEIEILCTRTDEEHLYQIEKKDREERDKYLEEIRSKCYNENSNTI